MQMSQIHKKTIKMGTKDNKEETNRKIENKKAKNKIEELRKEWKPPGASLGELT